MQIYCHYPRGGAAANYLENMAKLFVAAGYQVILISDINKGCNISEDKSFSFFDAVYPIEYSVDVVLRERQMKDNLAPERLSAMETEKISQDDIVFIYGIWGEYMLKELFAYREQIGFKVICGLTELFEEKDYKRNEVFLKQSYAREHLFIYADAMLVISDFLQRYYNDKNVRTFKFPPMIDCCENGEINKDTRMRKFVIATGKDSFLQMLLAFCMLSDRELSELEIHICGVEEDKVREILTESQWEQLKCCMVIHKWMSYEKLGELYRQVHFLLIARECCQRTLANFPSKVPETMAYGIVPVVSEVGDYTKYYLEDGRNSIFINGDSVEEIMKSIRKALDLSQEEYEVYSKEARKCAKSRFDYRNWISEIRNMIESV